MQLQQINIKPKLAIANTSIMKSIGGASFTAVPPLRITFLDRGGSARYDLGGGAENRSAGKEICINSEILLFIIVIQIKI